MPLPRPRPFPRATVPLSLSLLLALAASSGCGTAGSQEIPAAESTPLRFDVRTFDPLATPFDPEPDLTARLPESGRAYAVLQFGGPVRTEWKRHISTLGVRFHGYVPDRAFVVGLDAGRLDELRALPYVRWIGPYHPAYKLGTSLGTVPLHPEVSPGDPRHVLDIDLFLGEDARGTADVVESIGAEVGFVVENAFQARIRVKATLEQAREIASLEAVRYVEERSGIVMRNDTVATAVQSDTTTDSPVWDAGIHGEGQVVGVIDGAVDVDHCFFDDTEAVGPTHRKVVGWYPDAAPGAYTDSHGSHVAGTIAGEDLTGVSDSHNGVAWAAKLSVGDVDDIAGWNNTPSTLFEYLEAAWLDGARVHTNSWGEDYRTDYTTFAREADLYTWTYEDAMVAFAVSNTTRLYTPENGRNVLAVGATQAAPSTDTHYSGGTGPTVDGRRKPEVYAPGNQTTSTNDDTTCGTTNMGGTSMAAPAVAGAAALVRQYFAEGWYPQGSPDPARAFEPSGALLRGAMAHSGRNMTGVSGYPSDKEGWGKIVIDDVLHFPGDARRLWVRDVRHAAGLETGEVAEYSVEVLSGGQPLRVSLVWTDAYGTPGANPALVDDLDLEVVAPEGTYKGNVIDAASGESTLGGSADGVNNMEHVIVNPPTAGTYTIRVRGTDVPEGPQGYAVIVTGDVPEDGGEGGEDEDLDADGFTPADGDCDDGNAAVFPGATEVCNATDDDCDGSVDEGLPAEAFFLDLDGDGFGDPLASLDSCDGAPAGYVADSSDCDDTASTVNPGAVEVCGDGVDQDCDGAADEGCPAEACSVAPVSPVDGGNLSSGRVRFTGDCVAYVLQASTDASFPDWATHWYGPIAEAADTQTYTVSSSLWNTDGRYFTDGGYWRLVGVAADGTTTESEVRSFYTTKTPLADLVPNATCSASIVGPPNGSVFTNSPTWRWSGNCAAYRLEVSADSAFPAGSTWYYGRTAAASYRFPNTTWNSMKPGFVGGGYWRVVGGALDGAHPSTTYSFSTTP